MHRIAPEIKCGFLFKDWVIDAGRYCASHGITSYHPTYYNLTDEVIAEVNQYGLDIITYTVNTPDIYYKMQELGIYAVIGNYPDMTFW